MNILLVEDNEPEQIIMREAFKEVGVECDLHTVRDGVEALSFLKKEEPFEIQEAPDLIILDLNLPRKNGREFLTEMKNNDQWKHIPVLVFSNSESPRDICQCYSLNVNAYINKPSGYDQFIDFAHVINSFWLKLVRYCVH